MKITRRNFVLSIPFFLLACTKKNSTNEQPSSADTNKNLIDENHPSAKALKYVHNGNPPEADATKTEKNGVAPADQVCHNCQFYKAIGSDYGSCQMLPQGNVEANGWCSAWVKKLPTA